MKKNDANIKGRIGVKLVLLLLPFVLGIVGFKLARDDYSYLDAAYASLQMYFANIPLDWEYNIYIEIGRWMAPLFAVFFGIGLVVELVRGMIWPRFWAKLPSHYVVYGDDVWINALCGEKGSLFSRYCILEKDRYVNCRKYVLLFNSDRENLDFYTGFLLPKIRNRKVGVYMNILDLEPQDIQAGNLYTFQINEFIAISFFKNREWIDFIKGLVDRKNGDVIKVGIAGFGNLGKRMFQSALVMNIISENQKIEYHVWGDTAPYRRKHMGLSDRNLKPDRVIFHETDVNACLQFLEDFDVIFLCGQQEENLLVLSDLLRLTGFVGKGGRIYSYVENEEILKIFQVPHTSVKEKVGEAEKAFLIFDRLFPIPIPNKKNLLDQIIANNLSVYKRAEKKHEEYIAAAREKEKGKAVPEYSYFDWGELNSYLRWDNVSSTNYDDVRILLGEKGVPEERLAEFEHIRWLRCHYLDNWEYAKQRDDSAHRHSDLADFSDLPEEEKAKDRNFSLLFPKKDFSLSD